MVARDFRALRTRKSVRRGRDVLLLVVCCGGMGEANQTERRDDAERIRSWPRRERIRVRVGMINRRFRCQGRRHAPRPASGAGQVEPCWGASGCRGLGQSTGSERLRYHRNRQPPGAPRMRSRWIDRGGDRSLRGWKRDSAGPAEGRRSAQAPVWVARSGSRRIDQNSAVRKACATRRAPPVP